MESVCLWHCAGVSLIVSTRFSSMLKHFISSLRLKYSLAGVHTDSCSNWKWTLCPETITNHLCTIFKVTSLESELSLYNQTHTHTQIERESQRKGRLINWDYCFTLRCTKFYYFPNNKKKNIVDIQARARNVTLHCKWNAATIFKGHWNIIPYSTHTHTFGISFRINSIVLAGEWWMPNQTHNMPTHKPNTVCIVNQRIRTQNNIKKHQ